MWAPSALQLVVGPWLPPMTQVGASEGGKSPQVVSTRDHASLPQEKRRPLPSPQAPGGRRLPRTTSWCSRGPCPTHPCRPRPPALSSRRGRGAGPPSLSSLGACFRSRQSGHVPHGHAVAPGLLCLTATRSPLAFSASRPRSHPGPSPFLPPAPSLVTAVSFADESKRPRGTHL